MLTHRPERLSQKLICGIVNCRNNMLNTYNAIEYIKNTFRFATWTMENVFAQKSKCWMFECYSSSKSERMERKKSTTVQWELNFARSLQQLSSRAWPGQAKPKWINGPNGHTNTQSHFQWKQKFILSSNNNILFV